MLAFDVLGSAVRRRILELLGGGAMSSGEIVEAVQREIDISQPAVSQHLRVLRETGFTTVRADGQRRVYEIAATPPIAEIEAWLDRLRQGWSRRLDALETEVARGKRERRLTKHPLLIDQTPDFLSRRQHAIDFGGERPGFLRR